jgi:uncharacterized protein YfaP (DUF2135 family)
MLSGMPDHLREQAEDLQRRVRRGQRRSLLLAAGGLAAVLLGVVAWYLYYTSSVLTYASLDSEMQVERDPLDADRVTVVFRPTSRGKVGFRRRNQDRETEILDQVAAAGGDTETLQWLSRQLQVPAAPTPPPLGDSVLSGTVVDATTNQPVSGGDIRVLGTRLTAQTDDEGRFRIEQAPAGSIALEISADGYSTDQSEPQLNAGQETEVRVALSPGMKDGQMRIVLTWGKQPADLDAHLEGPLSGEQRFHVFHKQKGDLKSREFVSLDVDDRDGEGPETMTVLGVKPGKYHFFVHAPETSGNESRVFSESNAEVKLYHGGQTYRFRASSESPGNLWRVCDIEITPTGAVVERIDGYEFTSAEQDSIYAKRTQANREQWIAQYGGTLATERAVAEGLNWLARHQGEEGQWGPECLSDMPPGRCEANDRCGTPGSQAHMAQTGLALLAFQAGGHYAFNNRPYSEHVRKGLDWLVAHQADDGGLTSPQQNARHHSYMYEHGIAAFALAEACAIARQSDQDPQGEYLRAAEQAIRFIERQQNTDGGWRYQDSRQEASDTSVSGWQVLALKTAKEAGIEVNEQCLELTKRFFETCEVGETGQTGYTAHSGPHSHATTGVGMLVHEFLLAKNDSPLVVKGSEYLAGQAEQMWGPDRRRQLSNYYIWYNCTLAMFQAGGENWKRWNDLVREVVVELQVRDTEKCERGSWPPNSQWGQHGGRIYSTALAVLTLEVYYRYSSEKARVYPAEPPAAPAP